MIKVKSIFKFIFCIISVIGIVANIKQAADFYESIYKSKPTKDITDYLDIIGDFIKEQIERLIFLSAFIVALIFAYIKFYLPWAQNDPIVKPEPHQSISIIPPVKKINSDSPSQTVSQSLPYPVPEDDDSRRKALTIEAQLWEKRYGAEYHDFSEVKSTITESDKKLFNRDEQSAWNTLETAEKILKWPELGLTSETKSSLPIAIKFDGPESNFAGKIIISELKNELRGNGFKNIVDDIKKAALFIVIKDVVMDSYPYTEVVSRNYFQGECSFQITATWIGGLKALFGKYVADEKVMKAERYDARQAALDMAIKSTTRLFIKSTRQH